MTADPDPTRGPVRIGNCSGFYGDRVGAMHEMLTGGDLDYLTGDYLAELTMLILGRDRMKSPDRGYARTFLTQLEQCLGTAQDRGVRIVVNAGGLNPGGLATAVRALAERLAIPLAVAHVEGDDLLPRATELGLGVDSPLTANAYLGAWGIVECLNSGADIVVTGRVTDASVVVGPAAAHFGWARSDYDRLAGAVVAGHVIECGTQATGGNYSFFTEVADLRHAGFPLAEIHADGSSVITNHPGTGGQVSIGTVTAQLLYEIGGARYANPDATARFDTVALSDDGPDRVRISGVRGEPPPPTLKVSINSIGGYRNSATFVLTGLDIDAKADLLRGQLEDGLTMPPAEVQWDLARTDQRDAVTEQTASALLTCTVRDSDPDIVGRRFSSAAVELALASYPGFHTTAPPTDLWCVHRRVCAGRRGGPCRRARRWHPDTDHLGRSDARPRRCRYPAAAGAIGRTRHPAAAPGRHRRRPQRRQGRQCEYRSMGADRRPMAVARQCPDRRGSTRTAPGSNRSVDLPPPAAPTPRH